jgi:NAD(P)-dependent dehydrogenase (short-subunit alcohol dehydrogenase family)
MNYAFEGKTALVTGATSGIGRSTALAFAKAGAQVALFGRRQEEGDAAVKEITAAGGKAIFVQGDISKEEDVQRLVKTTVNTFGGLNFAFNNAGVEGDFVPTHEQTAENARTVMDINVLGVLFSMKHEIPAILASGGGAIVNTSSILGQRGIQGGSVYNASKFAVNGMTQVAALEYTGEGIRINSVCPAVIETDMADRFLGGNEEMIGFMRSQHPIGRFGKSSEISDAVLWLCSEQASFVSGINLPLDGGYTAK